MARKPAPALSPQKTLYKQFDTTVKAEDAPESRILHFTISSGAVDRDRDIVDPKGWQLGNYQKNPVVLWAHDYNSLPIARALSVSKTDQGLVASAEFPPADVNPFADTVYRMVKAGFLNATSVGFRPLKSAFAEERRGYDIQEQELLEFSVVPVPANPEALVQMRSAAGIDPAPLRAWAKSVLERTEEPEPEPEPERPVITEKFLTDFIQSVVAPLREEIAALKTPPLPVPATDETRDLITLEIIDAEPAAELFDLKVIDDDSIDAAELHALIRRELTAMVSATVSETLNAARGRLD